MYKRLEIPLDALGWGVEDTEIRKGMHFVLAFIYSNCLCMEYLDVCFVRDVMLVMLIRSYYIC